MTGDGDFSSNTRQHHGGPIARDSQVSGFGAQSSNKQGTVGGQGQTNRTMTLKTQKTTVSKQPDVFKMTSYETCLSKYTTYLRVKKFERSEALMR